MQRIGRYEIRRELGRGGFGRVYAAFDPTVARMVAIKTLTAVADADLLARFRNEAFTAGHLRHQNIVTIHDFGEHEGAPYLVMELLEGEDLQSVIANRRELSIYDKLRVLWEVADGLQHAHAHKIIHRDIKPANIMLVCGRNAKILDFGIALVTQTAISRLTPQGNLIGTYRYMAPEQFRGSPADPLADIFAYGVVCYELLSGVHPFDAPDAATVMYRIVSAEPRPLREHCPHLPAALDTVVLRILAKDREARYQNLEDVKFDIEPMLIESRKLRVAAVLTEAQARLSDNEITAAQLLVREALDLDRESPLARRLRDQIQREMQHRAIQPRLAALVDTAEQKLTERRFDEAIRDLESALRLDSTNTAVLEKIQSVRARREMYRRSEQHSDEAKRALRERNLTGALDHANEALLADPHNAAAAVLIEKVHSELLRREKARLLLELLGKAREMLLLGDHDDAISLLEDAETKFPDSNELRDLKSRARADMTAHEREVRLVTEINAGKEMLRRREFERAHACLENLQVEFPQTAELRDLLKYATEQWQQERDAQEVRELLTQAQSLLTARQFGAAITAIEQTLEQYPRQPGIRPLLQRALKERTAFEKEHALEKALASAGRLRDSGRSSEAAGVIHTYMDRYGADDTARALLCELESMADEQKGLENIRQLISDITQAFQENHLETATRIAQSGLAEYPDHPDLTALLHSIRGEAAQQQQMAEVEKVAHEAIDLIATHRFSRAVDITQKALVQYGHQNALLDAHRRATMAMSQREVAGTENQDETFKFAVGPGTLESGCAKRPPEFIPATASIEEPRWKKSQPQEAYASRWRKLAAAAATVVLAVAATAMVATVHVEAPPPLAIPPVNISMQLPTPPSLVPVSVPEVKHHSRGTLVVSTGLAGVEISLNGRKYGRTNTAGIFSTAVQSGRYTVQARRDGYSSEVRTIEIRDDQTQRLTLLPQPRPGQFAAFRQPTEAVTPAPDEPGILPAPVRPNLQTLPASEWDRLRDNTDPAAIEDFLQRNAGAPLATVAAARLEQLLWMRVKKDDAAELEKFLVRFPKGPFSAEAAARLGQIKISQPDKLAEDAPGANHQSKTLAGADQEGILRALERYTAALRVRSLQQLSSVWPAMPRETRESLRQAFKDNNVRYTIILKPLKPAEIHGDSAAVDCERIGKTVAGGLTRPLQSSRVRVLLFRRLEGWVISEIQDAR